MMAITKNSIRLHLTAATLPVMMAITKNSIRLHLTANQVMHKDSNLNSLFLSHEHQHQLDYLDMYVFVI
jgi:hypothetical protein